MLHILLHRQNKISTERSRVWKTTVVSVIRIHEKEAKEIHQLGAKRQLSEVLALVDGVSSQSALVSYTRWVTTCLLFFLPFPLVAPFGVRVGRRKVGGGEVGRRNSFDIKRVVEAKMKGKEKKKLTAFMANAEYAGGRTSSCKGWLATWFNSL